MANNVPARRQSVSDWQARMRSAMFEALDEEAVGEVVRALVEKAKKGDIQAARLLLTYAIGSPTVQVKNATIVTGGPQARTDAGLEPPPVAPTLALPGSEDKYEAMARRARLGQPVNDPRDGKRNVS